jgi:hypothetical protein
VEGEEDEGRGEKLLRQNCASVRLFSVAFFGELREFSAVYATIFGVRDPLNPLVACYSLLLWQTNGWWS